MWYNAVVKDLAKLGDAVVYFDNELKIAATEPDLSGSVEKASAALPGQLAYRCNQLHEIDAIADLVEMLLKKERAKAMRYFMEGYNKTMSATEATKWIEAEAPVIAMHELFIEVSLIRNRYLVIIKSLDAKGYQINNIVKMNEHGISDLRV